jgi:cystathionine gamma-synthase
MSELRPESVVVAAGRPPRSGGSPLSVPITLAAPFHHDARTGENAYIRESSSDTVRAFEDALGALEGGSATAFSTGMAAVAAIVEGLPAGSVAVVPAAAYSGTVSLFETQQQLGQLEIRPVDVTDTDAVRATLPGADLLWVETVTNPLMGVVDLPAVAEAAHREAALVVVDATFSTPLGVRPLTHGADVVMHSVTKFLSGHSDLAMGALVTATEQAAARLRHRRMLTGAIPGALETYLALRGMRTLAVRMARAQENATTIATRLASHPRVTRVRYPGLPSDPGHQLAQRLHDGYGAMLAFEIDGSAHDAELVCARVELISHATSLGGVESLIERRARYAIDAEHGTPETLLRLSVGIEHVEDLWSDLAQALGGS